MDITVRISDLLTRCGAHYTLIRRVVKSGVTVIIMTLLAGKGDRDGPIRRAYQR